MIIIKVAQIVPTYFDVWRFFVGDLNIPSYHFHCLYVYIILTRVELVARLDSTEIKVILTQHS